jgi:hypothetical protein
MLSKLPKTCGNTRVESKSAMSQFIRVDTFSDWRVYIVPSMPDYSEPPQEPALIPGIILSDLIIREAGSNKPSLIGCFQAFNFPQFPARIGRFFVSVTITNLRGRPNALNATCRLEVAGTGHVVSSVSAQIQFAPENPPLDPRVGIDISFPFMSVAIPSAGTYTFIVLIDNEEVGRRNIEVSAITAAAANPPI